VPAKIKDIKRIQESSSVEELPAEEVSVTTPHLMSALVNELIRSRLRFRALLRTLIAKEILKERDYVSEYEQEEDASFAVLADILLLEQSQVMQKHAAWLQSERGRLAAMSQGRSTPRVTLTPIQEMKPD
jgi:hypothetical protein